VLRDSDLPQLVTKWPLSSTTPRNLGSGVTLTVLTRSQNDRHPGKSRSHDHNAYRCVPIQR